MNGKAAILIIDLLNTFDFDGGDALKEIVAEMVAPLRNFREQARAAEVPVIFVNDNYGRWHDEPSQLIAFAIEGKGGDVIRQLAPEQDDYFVIKPESSGFYATTLPALLPRLGVSRLVMIGGGGGHLRAVHRGRRAYARIRPVGAARPGRLTP